jgi:hypothetical protein
MHRIEARWNKVYTCLPDASEEQKRASCMPNMVALAHNLITNLFFLEN